MKLSKSIRFYVDVTNRYGDNFITVSLMSWDYNLLAIEDFHCDCADEVKTYLETALHAELKIGKKVARVHLNTAISKFGVGKTEGRRRHDAWQRGERTPKVIS